MRSAFGSQRPHARLPSGAPQNWQEPATFLQRGPVYAGRKYKTFEVLPQCGSEDPVQVPNASTEQVTRLNLVRLGNRGKKAILRRRNSGKKPMCFRSVLQGILVIAAIALAAVISCAGQSQTATSSDNFVSIFAIGKENGSDGEFRNYGWNGTVEYVCRIGPGFKENQFPAELHVPGVFELYGVAKLKIVFDLEKPFRKVILRIVRGGDETTLAKVDDGKSYTVTNTMLGSGENFQVGSYNLDIGGLNSGEHTLEFTVGQDGKGNQAYQWDAI